MLLLQKKIKSNCSATGNRTPVSRVTGGDTSHYTIADCDNNAEKIIYKLYYTFPVVTLRYGHVVLTVQSTLGRAYC
jgi:gamma-glutamyltranspeptidase